MAITREEKICIHVLRDIARFENTNIMIEKMANGDMFFIIRDYRGVALQPYLSDNNGNVRRFNNLLEVYEVYNFNNLANELLFGKRDAHYREGDRYKWCEVANEFINDTRVLSMLSRITPYDGGFIGDTMGMFSIEDIKNLLSRLHSEYIDRFLYVG